MEDVKTYMDENFQLLADEFFAQPKVNRWWLAFVEAKYHEEMLRLEAMMQEEGV